MDGVAGLIPIWNSRIFLVLLLSTYIIPVNTKKANKHFGIHGRIPLTWNPLMINHDPAYTYTLDKNNSKHIQLKRKM